MTHLLLPGGPAHSSAVKSRGEEIVGGVDVVCPAAHMVGERRVIDGEEKDEDEGDEEGGSEEELGGGVEELGAVDSAEVAVVALQLYGLACIWRRRHCRKYSNISNQNYIPNIPIFCVIKTQVLLAFERADRYKTKGLRA